MPRFEWLIATIVVVTLIGVAIGRYPWLKMNRATIALVGATLLVGIGALTLEEAYRAVDWNTILLLFGMMVLNVNLRLAGFFSLVIRFVARRAATPRGLLAWVIAAAGLLSAVFLNDTIAIVMTPLVLDLAHALRRDPLPYLIALAVAANIGSVAAITGNPQNMLIGIASEIPFAQFTLYQAPVAAGGLLLAWAMLVWLHPGEFRHTRLAPADDLEPPRVYRPLLRKSLFATLLLLAALFAGLPIALAALAAAALLLITRRLRPQRVFAEIDWSLLVFFCGLFVVTGAIEASSLGAGLAELVPRVATAGTAAFTATAVLLSNLVSNVPAVMLFRPYIGDLANPTQAWLLLAMASTLAGNLTLLGSVANLIVAESAARRGVRLGFMAYLRVGLPVTLLTLAWGVLWLEMRL